jgi:hypothetical protein
LRLVEVAVAADPAANAMPHFSMYRNVASLCCAASDAIRARASRSAALSKRYFDVIGLSSGSASSIRTYQCLAEKDARVTSRCANAGHYIALHLRMPAKQSIITSMAASDAADDFLPGIEAP